MKKQLKKRCLTGAAVISLLLPGGITAMAGTVGILEPTVTDGANSPEALAAKALGHTVQLISAAQWAAMTTEQFAAYDALILGDPTCVVGTDPVSAAEGNVATWADAVQGNVIIIGADPTYHYTYSPSDKAKKLIDGGVAFALADEKTGAYITLSCYYNSAASGTPVNVLSGFGSFTVIGAGTTGAYNDVHIVASHPALSGIVDSTLSNWSASVHENIETWPEDYPSTFEVLAMALHSSGSYTAGDGTVGYPYILARGVIPARCGDGSLDPSEECDDGNNDPGDGCDAACNVEDFCRDDDGDEICIEVDNCPDIYNPDQLNTDGDAQGDACDPDDDNDTVLDSSDNCPLIVNPDQANNDGDSLGDICDNDDDNDDVLDDDDNCQFTANADQSDIDGDGQGDVCDGDSDGDGVKNADDNCIDVANSDQSNNDGDELGDACDPDDDNDGVADDQPDNCPLIANADQDDLDGDNIGDVCDLDIDGDGLENADDNCAWTSNIDQEDTDSDGFGDACDDDDDNDGVVDADDNCSLISNPGQEDADEDGQGDVCDGDLDGDGVANETDNCPNVANGSQTDYDGDGLGDACDDDIDGDAVINDDDACPFTELDVIIDSAGCSIDQLCPCEGPRGIASLWKNHGKYVSCTAKSAKSFVEAGLITKEEKRVIISEAARSECGHKKPKRNLHGSKGHDKKDKKRDKKRAEKGSKGKGNKKN